MTRQEIEAKKQANLKKIEALKKENHELAIQDIMLCDETRRYEEKEEEINISKRPKKTKKVLVGRIYWKEDFPDASTGEVITIERSQAVRVDGEWLQTFF